MSEALLSKVGRELKKLRRRKRLTQVAVAKALGVSQPNLSKLESGLENLTLNTLQKYSEVLGLEVCVSWKPKI